MHTPISFFLITRTRSKAEHSTIELKTIKNEVECVSDF